jgi:glucose/arabinose dehydrogenase
MAALGAGRHQVYDAIMARATRVVVHLSVLLVFLACQSQEPVASNPGDTTSNPGPSPSASCDAGNGGVTLPSGFCATVFADRVGAARHAAVSASGDLYVMLSGGGVLALRDTNHDGHSDVRATFGRAGGTGIVIRGDELYADAQSVILRYRLTPGTLQPASAPDTIVMGLPTSGHNARNIALDAVGNLFVNVGSITNVCEQGVRDPCAELPTRAAIFRFDAGALRQSFASGERYALGIRNAVGLAVNPADGKLYAMQHGRDNLYQSFGRLFTAEEGAENPAEELLQVNRGDDMGWPYCYYDMRAGKIVLAPEYGGDRQQVGRCSSAKAPLTVFPGHWAPNGLMFYTGAMFPARYRNGAFVAFHGSWNRAPLAQAGFRIAFVPASDGRLGSSYETFADGFAGAPTISDPNGAAHRPTGLAQGADGALFITDDKAGRIWRVVSR